MDSIERNGFCTYMKVRDTTKMSAESEKRMREGVFSKPRASGEALND